MFATVRSYTVAPGATETVMHRIDVDFAEKIADEPGFVSYQAVEIGDDMIMTISCFSTAAAAQASNDLAASWVASELGAFGVERVAVAGGETMVSRACSDALIPEHH